MRNNVNVTIDDGMIQINRRSQMKKLAIFAFTFLLAMCVPIVSMAHEGPGDAARPGAPGMSCGMKGMMPGGGMGGMMHKGMGRRHGEFGRMAGLMAGKMPRFYLMHARELKLTDDQIASLKKISFDMKKDFVSKGADVMLKRIDLKEALDKPDYKVEDVTAKLKGVEDARLALETAALQHAAQARDVLTPAQFKTLETLHKGCGMACCSKMKMGQMNMGDEPEEGEE
jgi:Spy/CpxP family protein refolding chaperone